MSKKPILREGKEKVAFVSDLDYKSMRALLKTLAEDDHALIHKLDIRHRKEKNNYRVITRIARIEDPENPAASSKPF